MGDQDSLPRSFLKDFLSLPVDPTVGFFGHVTLVEGIGLTNFVGCYAVVALRDTPGKEVGVVTSEQRLQSLLETALATGNLIAFSGHQLAYTPWGGPGTAADDLYGINLVTLYSSK
jgi:hypothetical protein